MDINDVATPYVAAIRGLNPPAALEWSVRVEEDIKRLRLDIQPDGAVVFVVPAGWPVERVTKKLENGFAATVNKTLLYAQAETPPEFGTAEFFDWFDVIVGHDSGGKDSQVAKLNAIKMLRAAGVMHKTAWLHIWLDKRDVPADEKHIEWHQVPELVIEQSARCGLPLADGEGWVVWDSRAAGEPVAPSVWAGKLHFARRDFDGDLLDDIATRRKKDGSLRGWPTMWTRYCTSDWKTAVGQAFTEYLCEQIRVEQGLKRPVRVLQIMGFRAQESDDRAARSPFALNSGVSARTKRHVWEWLPIHELTKVQVWEAIRNSGVPYHPVYDEGMSRLSCRACIMSNLSDLATMRRLVEPTFDRYVAIEDAQDDSFQQNRRLSSIEAAPGRPGFAVHWLACPDCGERVLARDWEETRHCPKHAASGPWNRPQLADDGLSCGESAPKRVDDGGQLDLFSIGSTPRRRR